MSVVLELSCWVYKRMLPLYADNLRYRYGDEMEQLFREQLMDAGKKGVSGIGRVWRSAVYDAVSLVGPAYLEPIRLWSLATLLSASVIFLTTLSFCTFRNIWGRLWLCAETRAARSAGEWSRFKRPSCSDLPRAQDVSRMHGRISREANRHSDDGPGAR
jgi:hypothetical protein